MTKKGKVLYDIVTEVAQSGGSTTPDAISLPPPSGVGSPGQVFVCPEESLFYSQAIEKLVLSRYGTIYGWVKDYQAAGAWRHAWAPRGKCTAVTAWQVLSQQDSRTVLLLG